MTCIIDFQRYLKVFCLELFYVKMRLSVYCEFIILVLSRLWFEEIIGLWESCEINAGWESVSSD